MKRCLRCMQPFEEPEEGIESPLEELSEIFLSGIEVERPEDYCPQCREELGMMTLLGFGE